MELDNIHFSFDEIDKLDKTFNFVVCERDPGKTTALVTEKLLPSWKEGKPWILLRRRMADITSLYINDLIAVFKKFSKEPLTFTYSLGGKNDGCVDVLCNGSLIFRVIALSTPMSRIKGSFIDNLGGIAFDEFIVSSKTGEKYLQNEYFSFEEIYTTFLKESDRIKTYFLGNPYSLFNPYFAELKIDTSKIKLGSLISGDDWAVQCYEMKPELKAKILAKNPLYKINSEYKKYAFFSEATGDKNIKIEKLQPYGFELSTAFKVGETILGVFKKPSMSNSQNDFYIKTIESTEKKIYCFDIMDVQQNCKLITYSEKQSFYRIANSMREHKISFATLKDYYLFLDVFRFL